MIAIACPGQGSQTPGFLSPWLEIDVFKSQIEHLQEVIKLDLVRLGTTADADEIRDTKIAQPLIVAASIASYAALREKCGNQLNLSGVAGHSVGEIAAAYVAGIFSAEDAMHFVNLRGQQMANAAALAESSMAAVVGGDADAVEKAIEGAGLFAANFNGPGQIVAAGSKSAIENLVANPPAGTRVVQLQVAGAFHTSFMEPAKEQLAAFAETVTVNNPAQSIWTNNDGSEISDGSQFVQLLVNQVSSPVRWDKTMNSMMATKVKGMIELVPGGTLAGIAKRAMSGVEAVALKQPADLEKAAELVERYS